MSSTDRISDVQFSFRSHFIPSCRKICFFLNHTLKIGIPDQTFIENVAENVLPSEGHIPGPG